MPRVLVMTDENVITSLPTDAAAGADEGVGGPAVNRMTAEERAIVVRVPIARVSGPAINRMTDDERAIVVRWLATIALERALEDLNAEERTDASAGTEPGDGVSVHVPTSDTLERDDRDRGQV